MCRQVSEELLRWKTLVCLGGDVTKHSFGIDKSAFKKVRIACIQLVPSILYATAQVLDSVTHTVHVAWTVNFNLPRAAYEYQIAGVRVLVDL